MLTIIKYTGRVTAGLLGYALAIQPFFEVSIFGQFGTFMIITACLAGIVGLGMLIVGLSPESRAVQKRYATMAPCMPLGVIYCFALIYSWYLWLALCPLLPVPMGFAILGGRLARRLVIRRKLVRRTKQE